MTHRALAQEGPISVERISRYPLSSAPKTPTQGACSITIERGRRLALGAALSLAGFAPSTTGRFSGVHRGTTINDFAKLGPALGGTPTIVERLPNPRYGADVFDTDSTRFVASTNRS